jgi:K+-sensing histidine kinase KdpD
MLGARLRIEEGEDLAAVAIDVAQAIGATYVLIGTPPPRRGLGRLRPGSESLLTHLLEGLPGVDVRIVADARLRRPPDQELLKSGGLDGDGAEGVSDA